jgi:hypothetical protein
MRGWGAGSGGLPSGITFGAFDGFCLSLYAPGSAMPSTDTSREPLSVAGNDNGRGKEKARR